MKDHSHIVIEIIISLLIFLITLNFIETIKLNKQLKSFTLLSEMNIRLLSQTVNIMDKELNKN